MSFDAWITLGTTAVVLLTLVCTSQPPDLIMIGALTLLLTVGVITPQEASLPQACGRLGASVGSRNTSSAGRKPPPEHRRV
jgi:hypothetical protein